MAMLKIFIGMLLLLLGLLYFYSPGTVMRLNLILREFICSDRLVLLYHKKIAILLMVFSLIALYMGFSLIPYETATKTANPTENARMSAMESYYNGNYRESLRHTYWVLSNKPNDEWALTHLAYIYAAMGKETKSMEISDRILKLYPDNKLAKILRPKQLPKK